MFLSWVTQRVLLLCQTFGNQGVASKVSIVKVAQRSKAKPLKVKGKKVPGFALLAFGVVDFSSATTSILSIFLSRCLITARQPRGFFETQETLP